MFDSPKICDFSFHKTYVSLETLSLMLKSSARFHFSRTHLYFNYKQSNANLLMDSTIVQILLRKENLQ